MTTALLILAVLTLLLGLLGLAVARAVAGDGYGHPGPGRTPPRSHHRDPFDPTRAA